LVLGLAFVADDGKCFRRNRLWGLRRQTRQTNHFVRLYSHLLGCKYWEQLRLKLCCLCILEVRWRIWTSRGSRWMHLFSIGNSFKLKKNLRNRIRLSIGRIRTSLRSRYGRGRVLANKLPNRRNHGPGLVSHENKSERVKDVQ